MISLDLEILEKLKGMNTSLLVNTYLKNYFEINSTMEDLKEAKKKIEEKLNPLIEEKEKEEKTIKEKEEKEEKERKEIEEKEVRHLHINTTFLSEHLKTIKEIKNITEMGAIREIFENFKKECPELDWKMFYKEFQNRRRG